MVKWCVDAEMDASVADDMHYLCNPSSHFMQWLDGYEWIPEPSKSPPSLPCSFPGPFTGWLVCWLDLVIPTAHPPPGVSRRWSLPSALLVSPTPPSPLPLPLLSPFPLLASSRFSPFNKTSHSLPTLVRSSPSFNSSPSPQRFLSIFPSVCGNRWFLHLLSNRLLWIVA